MSMWKNKPEKVKDSLTLEELKKVAKKLGYTLQKMENRKAKKKTSRYTPKERVIQAQTKMIQNGEKITILGVSREAKVSRTTARKYLTSKKEIFVLEK